MADDLEHKLRLVENEEFTLEAAFAPRLADLTSREREQVVARLLSRPEHRRWLRAHLLPLLPDDQTGQLAITLLGWHADFAPNQRDRTTSAVVDALPFEVLVAELSFLAGSNAATRLWERLARVAPERLGDLALQVLQAGNAVGRETMLHILLLDPYSPASLAGPQRQAVAAAALEDAEDEIRGLAAELVADEFPEDLLNGCNRWVRDPGERVRTAAWDVAFANEPGNATELAVQILMSEAELIAVKRTALMALGHALPTPDIAPLLASAAAHPERELAEDAANLLWSLHRTPEVADAASRSPHAEVREVAQRLLHPELGSPAAGGSRPGAPNPYGDIYQQMLKGYEVANSTPAEPEIDSPLTDEAVKDGQS